MAVRGWALAELVEAATHAGEPAVAAAAMERLSEQTRASGTEWALGTEARCRAMRCDGQAAEDLYRESISRLGNCRMTLQLARARLVYGEWLRRSGRRLDARAQLRTAYDMLASMGADGFAERARRELLATGEAVRKPAARTVDQLTAQELQIARLARGGRTNQEIGVQLFISSRTVEWHLRKVFAKLDIGSRRQLDQVLPTDRHTPVS